MLTSDLVRPVIRSGSIAAPRLAGKKRTRAIEIAEMLIAAFNSHVGKTREDLEAALAALEIPALDLFLFRGLRKLAYDGSTFESPSDVDPPALRRLIFAASTKARKEGNFDREKIVAQVAQGLEISAQTLDAALFADLKSAQLLLEVTLVDASFLVDEYDRAGPAAILLKAQRVVVDIVADAATFRRVFHRLKFLRLLFDVEPVGDGWRLTIDGPMSLFSGQARYGLKLALALRVLEECEVLELEAEVRWGKRRTRLAFKYEGGGGPPSTTPAREEVTRLIADFPALECDWMLVAEPTILVAKSIGACVSDMSFVHQKTGEVIHLEILGYWSRDAVWRRVDLVGAGLNAKVIFAFSEKLRVSERALDDDLPSSLLSFKGLLRASAVLKALNHLSTVDAKPRKKTSAKKTSAKKTSAKKTSEN